MYALEAKGIKKSFGGVKALVNGELLCPQGKVCGLLGANGSGKTTLSRIITGFHSMDEGVLKIYGQSISFKTPADSQKAGIAMIHQNLSLIPELKVWENIALGREPRGNGGFLATEDAKAVAKEHLARLYPELDIHKKVYELAPWEKQIIEIAKALAQKPKLLILDEPTAALENSQVERLFKLLFDLKSQGVSMIFISHRMTEVMELCDFLVILRNGETVGTVDFSTDGKDEKKIVSLITGTELQKSQKQRRDISDNEIFLEVQGMTVGRKIMDVSFKVRKGEIIGFGGLQGHGQEELLLALAGYFPLSNGRILLQGKSKRFKHPVDAIHQGIMLVPGDRHKEGLFLTHSILANFNYPKFSLKKTKWLVPFQQLQAETSQSVQALSIKTHDLDTEVKNLSGGNQQKVVLGKWLALKPQVLLLSDPAKGVDVGAKKELYDVVLKLADEGTLVILYASDSEELISYCDRVLIMYEGRIVEEFRDGDIMEERIIASSIRVKI